MQPNDYTDEELLDALRRGGALRHRAWEFMYKQWRNYWLGLILKRGGTPDEADDALARVAIPFERAVTTEGFNLERAALRTYLITCVLREWGKQRKKEPPPSAPVEDGYIKVVAESVDKAVMRRELADAVDALINILGERCRRILRMFGQGMSMEEIAEVENWKDADKAKKEKYECQTKLKNHLRDNPALAKHLKELCND